MYHEFTPCAALVPFIDKFWVFKGFTDIGTRFKILADGCCLLYTSDAADE